MSSRDVSGPYRPAPETGDYGRSRPEHRASQEPRGGYDGAGYPGGRRRRDDYSGRDGDQSAPRGRRGRPGDGWGDYPAGNAPAPAGAGYWTPARPARAVRGAMPARVVRDAVPRTARAATPPLPPGQGPGPLTVATAMKTVVPAPAAPPRATGGPGTAEVAAGVRPGAERSRAAGGATGRGGRCSAWPPPGSAAWFCCASRGSVTPTPRRPSPPTSPRRPCSSSPPSTSATAIAWSGRSGTPTGSCCSTTRSHPSCVMPWWRPRTAASTPRAVSRPKASSGPPTRTSFNSGGSGGSSLQGGSTITQQFVRNYYANIGTEQTASRKMKEIFVALKVAKEKSKAWILTNYLNTIYLGQGAYGVGAAAETYFGIPASQLDAAQAAYIAAIIQSPSYYPTPAGQPALMTRWHYVLNGMVALGDLSAQQAAAEHFPKVLSAQDQHVGSDPYDSYILGLVDNELQQQVQVLAGPDRQRRAAHHDHDQQVDDGPALQCGEPEREADGGRRRGAALVRAGGRGAAGPADRGHYGLLRRPRRERPGQVLPQHLLRQHRADPGAGGVVVQAVRTGYRGRRRA